MNYCFSFDMNKLKGICECSLLVMLYSHLKHFMEIPKQIRVTAPITTTGIRAFSIGNPRNAAFINWIPCVIGKTLMIFCMETGITSKGSVVPEKISMGKYKRQAITLAVFIFLAIPPTNRPMLNVDTIVQKSGVKV